MLTGYNTDIRHGEVVLHVQTEDKGRENPAIETVIYLKGQVLAARRTPYAKLLEEKVEFYVALGNHDNQNQRFYKPFHMEGERYYSFSKGDVKFFALDSNYMDEEQLAWLQKELDGTKQPWRIAFFHHPLYSSGGKHGSDMQLRAILEPLFVKYKVALVLTGHDHFYERIKPQRGIHHFVIGGSSKLREGDVKKSNITAASFDTDNSFVLMEIQGDTLNFQAISRTGATVDSGSLRRAVDQKIAETLQ